MPRPHLLTLLVLDGTRHGHETSATLARGFLARILTASTVESLAHLALAVHPDIAILGKGHSFAERQLASHLLAEIDPRIKVVTV